MVEQMRSRGIEVVEVHEALAKVLDDKASRAWILDRKVKADNVGIGMLHDLRSWLDEMPSSQLAEHMVGGIAKFELPFDPKGLFGGYLTSPSSCCRRCRTACSSATRLAGSMRA